MEIYHTEINGPYYAQLDAAASALRNQNNELQLTEKDLKEIGMCAAGGKILKIEHGNFWSDRTFIHLCPGVVANLDQILENTDPSMSSDDAHALARTLTEVPVVGENGDWETKPGGIVSFPATENGMIKLSGPAGTTYAFPGDDKSLESLIEGSSKDGQQNPPTQIVVATPQPAIPDSTEIPNNPPDKPPDTEPSGLDFAAIIKIWETIKKITPWVGGILGSFLFVYVYTVLEEKIKMNKKIKSLKMEDERRKKYNRRHGISPNNNQLSAYTGDWTTGESNEEPDPYHQMGFEARGKADPSSDPSKSLALYYEERKAAEEIDLGNDMHITRADYDAAMEGRTEAFSDAQKHTAVAIRDWAANMGKDYREPSPDEARAMREALKADYEEWSAEISKIRSNPDWQREHPTKHDDRGNLIGHEPITRISSSSSSRQRAEAIEDLVKGGMSASQALKIVHDAAKVINVDENAENFHDDLLFENEFRAIERKPLIPTPSVIKLEGSSSHSHHDSGSKSSQNNFSTNNVVDGEIISRLPQLGSGSSNNDDGSEG